MTFLIFLIILGVLVFVHELGHFLVAKRAGVRVDEFGFGYPPRALKIGEKWGTLFTLNWIPFGGFVKILGENYEEDSPQKLASPESPRVALAGSTRLSSSQVSAGKSFTQVSKKWQAAMLVAGITFNILFAWLLFSLGFMIGLPTPVDNNFGGEVKNPALTITGLLDSSPAQKAGLKTGDKIKNISLANGKVLQALNPEDVSNFINNSLGQVDVEVLRGGKILDFKLTPETDIENGRKIIGISMDMVGTLYLPIHKAIYEGGKTTLKLSYLTIAGIANLIKDAIRGHADISQVAGPVGIIGLVGDASKLGFAYLLTFTALISVNLAIINLIPFPALDGGRILFVAIEGMTKKKINPKIAGTLNTIGFVILIALMLIVTYRDILRLF
jgi:regulator of sigma E protease